MEFRPSLIQSQEALPWEGVMGAGAELGSESWAAAGRRFGPAVGRDSEVLGGMRGVRLQSGWERERAVRSGRACVAP